MNTILDKLKIELQETNSELKKEILEIIIDAVCDDTDDENITAWMQDVMTHGCISGMVNGLLYYSDTTEFYQKHCLEIEKLIREFNSETGSSIQDFWKEKDLYDDEENYTYYNIAAWFAMENLTDHYYHKLEIEEMEI